MQIILRWKKAEHKLAPELWHTVAGLLQSENEKETLAHLSQVSSHLLAIARPYLYREVDVSALGNDMTMQLLCRDEALAKVVQYFRVTMPPVVAWYHEGRDAYPKVTNTKVIEAVFKMSSLETLEMVGSIFSFPSEQERFIAHFKNREKPLRKLAFREEPALKLFPTEGFALPGLTHLYWGSYRDQDMGRRIQWDDRVWIAFLVNLASILEASKETLEHIAIPCISSRDRILSRIFEARFSQIRTVRLGDVQFDSAHPSIPFAKFLAAHPTIERIWLDNFKDVHYSFGTQPSPYLNHKILPNLKEFRGNTHVFLQLALVRPLCFKKTLRRLELIPNRVRYQTHPLVVAPDLPIEPVMFSIFTEMFTALVPNMAQPPPFPVLKEFLLDLSDWARLNPQQLCDIIEWVARCCGPSLEVWLGSLPPMPIASAILGNMFKAFPKLRVIHLCEKVLRENIYDPEWESVSDYVATLGRILPSLEKVIITSHQIIGGNIFKGPATVNCTHPISEHVILREELSRSQPKGRKPKATTHPTA